MPDPTTTDDDLADEIPPAAPTCATGAARRRRPTRVLALLAVAAAVVATVSDTDGEDVHAGTTTSPTTTETSDLPLLETTWWLEWVEMDGEAPVVTPDRSLTLLLTEDRVCAGVDDCPDPHAFLVGTDGCRGFMATVDLAADRLTARPWSARITVACPSRPGDEISGLENGTSMFAIEGDTLVLRLSDRPGRGGRAGPPPPAAGPTTPRPTSSPPRAGATSPSSSRWRPVPSRARPTSGASAAASRGTPRGGG